MTEIVETKDRKGRTRFGWRCNGCKAAAGRWPEKSTAENSAGIHGIYCKSKKAAAA